MSASTKLAGVVQKRECGHRKASRGHGEVEERVVISPRGSVWPEKEEKRPGARRGGVQGR